MAATVCYVVLHKGQWKIKLGDQYYGPYNSQCEAIDDAVETAHKEGQANRNGAQVLVQGRNNEFRAGWTYGNDPYPPKSRLIRAAARVRGLSLQR